MTQPRLVNGFQRVSVEEADTLKRVNKCQQVAQSSPRWEIYWGTDDPVMLPDSMTDLRRDMLLNKIIHQNILIFESAGEAYLVVCQGNLVPEIIKAALLKGSESAFSWVSQLAASSS